MATAAISKFGVSTSRMSGRRTCMTVPALKMGACGMLAAVPAAMSTMAATVSAFRIHWRRYCQTSCHHDSSKR
jgi:hypothetical protein